MVKVTLPLHVCFILLLNLTLVPIELTNRMRFIFCIWFKNRLMFSISTVDITLHTLFLPYHVFCTGLSFPPLCTVARAESEEDAAAAEVVEGADLGIVGDDTQVSSDGPLSPAPGVETVVVFPKNAGKSEYAFK
jgi:hypothetical protein